ncbi:MAG TPA: glycosyltransferase family 4 protein [Actinomycetota bacterium]|nr:glycosyltransferase family 4 protein [Actinomycetota bacterium]
MPDAVLVSSSFLPGRGGIETFLAELCGALAPRLAVVAPARRGGEALPHDLPYPVRGFAGRLFVPGPRAARATVAAARYFGTDRVLFGTPWPQILTAPRLQRARLRYAAIVHGAELLVPAAIPVMRTRLLRALARADLLLPVSLFTAQRMRELLENAGERVPPIAVLRARVDLDRFHPDAGRDAARARLGIPADAPVILCLGRMVARKGIDRLIRALPEIEPHAPGVTLVLAGAGPEEKALRRAAARVPQRVVFAGRVPDEEAPATYTAADVFALPVADRWRGLDTEGLGVVLLEAAASGVPCVTGRSGGTPEAVVDGVTGFVVDARDPERLAGSIARLLEDRALARRMGRAGRRHVGDEFGGRIPEALTQWLE